MSTCQSGCGQLLPINLEITWDHFARMHIINSSGVSLETLRICIQNSQASLDNIDPFHLVPGMVQLSMHLEGTGACAAIPYILYVMHAVDATELQN